MNYSERQKRHELGLRGIMSSRVVELVRRNREAQAWVGSALKVIVLGALLGNVSGLIRAILIIAENKYLAQNLYHLAAVTLAVTVSYWTWWALITATAAFAATLILWPVVRLVRGSWQAGLIGAAAAVPTVILYIWIGWYVNKHYLPGLWEATSVGTNLLLSLLSILLWYGATRLGDKLSRTTMPYAFGWTRGWVPLILIFLNLAATQAAGLLVSPSLKDPRVNVLVLLVDALRPDRLGAYGYRRSTSPNIDQLAQDGYTFTQAISTAPWTKPAVASLFTSLYPLQHGIDSGSWGRADEAGKIHVDVLNPRLTTLAEVMANGGYHTAAIGNNHHLTSKLGFAQGFGTYIWGLKGEDFTSAP